MTRKSLTDQRKNKLNTERRPAPAARLGVRVLELEAAAAAHFYASTPAHLMMPAGEFVFGLGVIGPDPLVPEPKFTIKNGKTRVPNAPGLGVEIDEDALQRLTLHRVEVTEND